jgi:hypothetical protein
VGAKERAFQVISARPTALHRLASRFFFLRNSHGGIGFGTTQSPHLAISHRQAPERNRKTTWKEVLSRHKDVIAAADFFTVEVWTAQAGTWALDELDGTQSL